ncbi:MAG: class I SAM-dependent methyltransferase [Bdellovibrionaceae bacterium]|nr:class I SAM-dependent methyltransferase [Pseudobdellovibrionaceae bacterium]
MGIAEEYWNAIYKSKPFAKGKEADPFLTQVVHRLQKGKTLDLGMGEGQNAVFLASKGHSVKGIDISSNAIENAKQLALEKGQELQVERTDLDLLVLGLMEYDNIIMIDFKPPITRYYSEISRALKQGGTLLVKSYMDSEMPEALGSEDAYKNFYYYSNELIKNFGDLKILYYNEDKLNGKKVVQFLAQKPLDKDAAKYNLFNMHSQPKETGMSRQRELAEALFKKKD